MTRHDDRTPSPETIAAYAVGHATLVTKEVPVDVKALPDSVQLICEAGTGFNNINLEDARARGITVCNVPAYSTDAVAQLVMTYVRLLSLRASAARDPGARRQDLVPRRRDERRARSRRSALPHFELAGKTIGLIGGTGAIGAATARLAKAFGMDVLVWSRSAGRGERVARGARQAPLASRISCPCTARSPTKREA